MAVIPLAPNDFVTRNAELARDFLTGEARAQNLTREWMALSPDAKTALGFSAEQSGTYDAYAMMLSQVEAVFSQASVIPGKTNRDILHDLAPFTEGR